MSIPSSSVFVFSKFRRAIFFHSNYHFTLSSTSLNPNRYLLFSTTQPKPSKSNLQDALVSFNQLLKSTSTPSSIYSINNILGNIVKLGEYHKALSLIKQLHLQGVRADVYTLSIAINCYYHLNRIDFGFSLLTRLIKCGYKPNVITFNPLIMGLFAQHKISQAKELYIKLVRDEQIQPNGLTYGTLVNGLCKSGNTKPAIEILRSMEKHNFDYKADAMVRCYTIIIHSLCKDQMVTDAKNLFDEMTNKGFRPDVITYTSLLQGLCNFSQLVEASKLVKEMLAQNVVPNKWTFSIIMDAYCKQGMIKEAEDALKVMTDIGVLPNLFMYNTLMDGYCLLGKMKNARRLFNSMMKMGIEPDDISYNTLINGYCKKKRTDLAINILGEMHRKGIIHTEVAYNTILHGLYEKRWFDSARELFEEMLARGIRPDSITYGTILNGMCINGKIGEALLLFRSLQKNPKYIDIVCYTVLIDALCKNGKLEISKELFVELLSYGLRPSVCTYTVLINGLCKDGCLDEAKELLVLMEENGCFPNGVTYNVIVRGFLMGNKMNEAMELLKKMRERGFSIKNFTSKMLAGFASKEWRRFYSVKYDFKFTTKIRSILMKKESLGPWGWGVDFCSWVGTTLPLGLVFLKGKKFPKMGSFGWLAERWRLKIWEHKWVMEFQAGSILWPSTSAPKKSLKMDC